MQMCDLCGSDKIDSECFPCSCRKDTEALNVDTLRIMRIQRGIKKLTCSLCGEFKKENNDTELNKLSRQANDITNEPMRESIVQCLKTLTSNQGRRCSCI